MKYLKSLPQIAYPRIENDEPFQYQQLTNLLTRSAFLKEIVENTGIFYEYDVKEGETPEIIADKLYGDVERFWIVLLFNSIKNPYYDFPLTSSELDSLFQSKYGYDAETAQITHHHYERKVTRTVLVAGAEQSSNTDTFIISAKEANSVTGIAQTNPYLPGTPDTTNEYDSITDAIDSTTSVVTTFTIANVSVYTYELNANEARRKIRLLDPQYVGRVEQEFRILMNN